MEEQEPKPSPEEWQLNQARKRLVYLKYLQQRGHDVSKSEIEELQRSIQEKTAKISNKQKDSDELRRRHVADLQERIALSEALEGEHSKKGVKLLVYQMNHVKVRMRPEQKHQRAHFHIEFKGQHSASYAVDTLERLDGEMPSKYEDPILKWAEEHRASLEKTWEALNSGEDVRELVIAEQET